MNETNMSTDSNVIFAILKLSRAMRRCPPDPGKPPFPPAIGRLLACVSENSGISSRELCEMLDLRPSSLSEMLSRAEQEGWITRLFFVRSSIGRAITEDACRRLRSQSILLYKYERKMP